MNSLHSLRTVAAGLALCTLVSLSGCYTSIKAKEVTADKNAADDGLRYYLPAPYLVIEQTGDNKWDARLELGVDRSHEYYVQPNAVLAKGNAIIAFNDDGTLKSFKLDADSTAVASSVVDAAKEIELKRLELQKAALDAAQKKKDDKGGDSALRAVAGERAFAIYRVNGEQIAGLAKPTSKSYVDDKISLQAASGQAPAKNDTGITTDPTSLTVQTSVEDDEAYVITYLKRPLTDGDKAKLHFKTKSGQDKAVPADQLTVTDKGTILVKKDQLPDVVRVVLDQP